MIVFMFGLWSLLECDFVALSTFMKELIPLAGVEFVASNRR